MASEMLTFSMRDITRHPDGHPSTILGCDKSLKFTKHKHKLHSVSQTWNWAGLWFVSDVVALKMLLGAVFLVLQLKKQTKTYNHNQMRPHVVVVAFVYWAVPIARYTLSILLASLWDRLLVVASARTSTCDHHYAPFVWPVSSGWVNGKPRLLIILMSYYVYVYVLAVDWGAGVMAGALRYKHITN